MTADDDGRRILVLDGVDQAARPKTWRDPQNAALPEGPVELRMRCDPAGAVRCAWRADAGDWQALGAEQNLAHISDEHPGEGQFTGAFIGTAACDQRACRMPAYFSCFCYE